MEMANKKQRIHFIGIGGIGVSALARYWLARGEEVSGSDAAGSEIIEDLRKIGAKIPPSPPFTKWGKNAKSPLAPLLQSGEKIDLVIYSAAVQEDDQELVEARRLNIKTQKYAEALGEITREKYTIAVSGMHGKSTTTAMIGLILEKAGLDPTVIVGTKVRWNSVKYNSTQPPLKVRGGENTKSPLTPLLQSGEENYSNFRAGESKYLVIEADEYDRSFLNYWPKILVLLNIEEEHLDTYTGGLLDIIETFGKYILHLPEDGVLIVNKEDKNILKLISDAAPTPTSSPSQREGESQRGWEFRVINFDASEIKGLNLKISGQHNLSNANAALAVARVLGINEKIAIEALNNFLGTWRRMEYKGELNGAKIYDDYGHHPTEIKATLRSAAEIVSALSASPSGTKGSTSAETGAKGRRNFGKGTLWCVFQPHQYQRTYKLFEQFINAFGAADQVILLPIYSVAGREDEEIKKKVSSEKLAEAIKTVNSKQLTVNNKKEVLYMEDFDKTIGYLRKNLGAGDVCVIMGAGDIYKLTERLI